MTCKNFRWLLAGIMACNLATLTPGSVFAGNKGRDGDDFMTETPIKHVVVIFQENVSFDHYFGTYPNAVPNLDKSVYFPHAKAGTPAVNGLQGLLTSNPNSALPFRLDRSQALTCDMDHDYTPEQLAFDRGLMDKFPENTSPTNGCASIPSLAPLKSGVVMGYYDGNTVTALWNYAQYFSLNDNSYGTGFGPSTPGALNLVSGQTGFADLVNSKDDASGDLEADVYQIPNTTTGTVIGDADPFFDDCSGNFDRTSVLGNNIGDLLNAKYITWGWFQGGFTPTSSSNGTAVCGATTTRLDGVSVAAYSAHHNPFEYYEHSANQHHTPPANLEEVGRDGQAKHQYDLSYFFKAASAGRLPAVSFLKANRAQDGHPSNSTPLDEQQFLVDTINFLQSLDEWDETAVFILWDDSDGWYDHQLGEIINGSTTKFDAFTAPGQCGNGAGALNGIQARCGYGPRLPLLVISPYAKENFVDRTLTDQTSPIHFIEDNFGLGRIGDGSFDAISGSVLNMFDFNHKRQQRVFLDDITGKVASIQGEN
jgi:phospholipase C